MRNSFTGLCVAMVIALLIGCAQPHRHHPKKKVEKLHVNSVWVPGHYGPAGKWISGHWSK